MASANRNMIQVQNGNEWEYVFCIGIGWDGPNVVRTAEEILALTATDKSLQSFQKKFPNHKFRAILPNGSTTADPHTLAKETFLF